MKILFLITYLTAVLNTNPVPAPGNVKATVNTFRNSNGYACFALFNKSDGFPGNDAKALKVVYAKIINKTSEVVFENLPAGTYAISVFHEENGRKKMDSNFIGIPKEGVGSSNNPKPSFGPPDFDDAKFKFSGDNLTVNINIRYL
jgi:uncharacterized protein (DUF2141 family)